MTALEAWEYLHEHGRGSLWISHSPPQPKFLLDHFIAVGEESRTHITCLDRFIAWLTGQSAGVLNFAYPETQVALDHILEHYRPE
jgi:hypothetical protein